MWSLPLLLAVLVQCSASLEQVYFNAGPLLQQPGSPSPKDFPYRALEWKEFNVLHTTDTHGWLLGHQHKEAAYSGDWGDLYSFVIGMKAEARRRGVDLLLVDSGDRVDGNGLVDAEPPEHVKGWTAMRFFREMPYDIITTGNHELYSYQVALSTYQNLATWYGDRYVTSNVNITFGENGVQKTVPLGSRCRKFVTEQGRRVTAFGVIFNFKAHQAGTDIQSPSEMVLEPWFTEAIKDRPDVFIISGHMSIREGDSEFSTVVGAIRAIHPLVPVLVFGGHHHIRDCYQEDSRSMSLASGRYMETVGFMSVGGLDDDSTPLNFSRRYLDQNRNTYEYHLGGSHDTDVGRNLSLGMAEVALRFNLTTSFGTAPNSFFLGRYPLDSESSMFNLLVSHVLPLLVNRPDRPYPHLVLLNTGSVRFDVFQGPFTRNDQWIILPFTNNFRYIAGVKSSVAARILEYLNVVGEHGLLPSSHSTPEGIEAATELVYRRQQYNAYAGSSKSPTTARLSLGYVTHDSCPGLGDDVLHSQIPAVAPPIFVATVFPAVGRDDLIDVVYFDFIEQDIVAALNVLQQDRIFSSIDSGLYIANLTANTLMETYAARVWN